MIAAQVGRACGNANSQFVYIAVHNLDKTATLLTRIRVRTAMAAQTREQDR